MNRKKHSDFKFVFDIRQQWLNSDVFLRVGHDFSTH